MVSSRAAYASAVTPPGNRPHSIAVFGCTGNAGRAVAYHAIKSSASKQNISIALSGRNRDKVEKVLQSIHDELRSEGVKSDDANVEIIIADASDEQSMLNLAKSTNILISCAGPYGRYGEAAVKACVEGGAHYVDITGEVDWVERMISDYGAKAEEAGVVLCPFSGYDCVPAELGMWLVGTALEMDDAKMGQLALNFRGKGGGFPRGTLETVLDGLDGKGTPRREGDPRFYPKEYRGTAKAATSLSQWVLPKYQLGQFTGPNVMSAINVPVLCRAAPTLGFSSDFTISDKSVVGRPTLLNGYGLFPVQMYIAALVMGGIALVLPPFRGLFRGKLKTYSYNGDPSGKVFLDAQGIATNKKSSAMAKCVFPGDAGIYATGLFAVSVANSLQEATTAGSQYSMPPAGFHSPVAALHGCRQGLLVDNLRALGADIRVEVVPEKGGAKEVDATKLRSKL
mmetsp:Transcript_23164/g.42605  ORF Transcript_23164/g.42605 Transcript_23164/m.42605 type:complete len:454 (+) Transcript_23164:188-1549(+)